MSNSPLIRDGGHPKTRKESISKVITIIHATDYYSGLKELETEQNPSQIDSKLQNREYKNSETSPPSPTTTFYFRFFSIAAFVLVCLIVSIVIIINLRNAIRNRNNDPERVEKKFVRQSPRHRRKYYHHTTHSYCNSPNNFARKSRSQYAKTGSAGSCDDSPRFEPPSHISSENETLTFEECISLLEVSDLSTLEDVNRAFRKKCLNVHPDKCVNLPESLKEERTRQFRLLCHARDKITSTLVP